MKSKLIFDKCLFYKYINIVINQLTCKWICSGLCYNSNYYFAKILNICSIEAYLIEYWLMPNCILLFSNTENNYPAEAFANSLIL